MSYTFKNNDEKNRHRARQRKARNKILAEANRHRSWSTRPLSMRHLQRAVCIVRRRRLVDGDTLIEAGFNAY